MKKQGLSALIFGATGAIGADLVQILLSSSKWSRVHCVVRKPLEEWKNISGKEKLTVQSYNDLDDYFKLPEHKYENFDSLFCCLGSQVKHGQETFIKIDKTYPLLAADIAIKYKIPHYLFFSSLGGDPKSWFLYLRTKGQAQEELKLKKLNYLSIFKPGILKNRRGARTVEKIAAIFPFISGIQAKDSADVLRIIAEEQSESAFQSKQIVKIYENKDMLKVVESKK